MTFIKKYFILACALALLGVAGTLVAPLHKAQIRKDLTSEPVKGVGPDIVLFTTALGAFRGIAINVIWIRMERLKQDGKFFEIAQLADLACRLAPRFPKVWDFNAWNMAYNISVQIPNLRERWPWVRRGIELLRDQGIPNNPEEPELYFSLAWIYMQKVGDQLDDAHFWYKQQLGLKMHEVLKGRGTRDFLQEMAEAPRQRETLLQDEAVNDLYRRLVENGFDPLRIGRAGEMRYFDYIRNPDAIPESARALMEAEGNEDALKEIDRFARSYRLRNQLKMIPEIMLDLMDEYGPLDWRNAFSHALYWATLGRRVAVAFRKRALWQRARVGDMSMEEIIEAGQIDADEALEWSYPYRYRDIDYDRIIYASLQKFVTQGRLLFDSRGQLIPMMGPDYRFTEPMIDQFERMLARYGAGDRGIVGIRSAYEHFLRRATIEFFYMGATSESRRYYQKLQERFPKDAYRIPHERFVTAELREYAGVAGPSEMRRMVTGLLYQSFLHLGGRADERAEALYGQARRMARIWNEERIREDDDTVMRQAVDFQSIRESALIDIFSGVAGFPDEFIDELREQLPGDLVERVERAAQERDDERELRPMDEQGRMQDMLRQRR